MMPVLNWRVKEIDFSRQRFFLPRRTIRHYEMKPMICDVINKWQMFHVLKVYLIMIYIKICLQHVVLSIEDSNREH